jgi:hypothetical protein
LRKGDFNYGMEKMKTVKIGLIGCGRVSSLHVEGYQKTEGESPYSG